MCYVVVGLPCSFMPPFSNISSTSEGYDFDQLVYWKFLFGLVTFAAGRHKKERSCVCACPKDQPCSANIKWLVLSTWHWGFLNLQPFGRNTQHLLKQFKGLLAPTEVGRNIRGLRRNFSLFVHTLFFFYKCHICFLCFDWSPLGSILLCYVQNLHTELLLLPKGILVSFIVSI